MLALAGGVAAQTATPGAAEQAVTAAENLWLKSQQTNNVDLVASLMADKVVETTAEGEVLVGREAVLADAKTVTWSSVTYADLKVTVFRHTAIATGTFVGKGKDATGKTLEEKVRFTDTWVEMSAGKWLCVATQDTALKM